MKIKREHIENTILALFVIIIIAGLLFTIFKTKSETSGIANNENQETRSVEDSNIEENKEQFGKTKSSGSTDPNDVAVDIRPLGFDEGSYAFEISANTHSVDLSQFNLLEITTLRFNGLEIKPESAPTLSGHHNSGELVFSLDEEPDKFEIEIIGIPDVNRRVFSWG